MVKIIYAVLDFKHNANLANFVTEQFLRNLSDKRMDDVSSARYRPIRGPRNKLRN